MTQAPNPRVPMAAARDLSRYGWLSLAAALIVFVIKLIAWRMTDSVGLLSDALESTVNIVAAVIALIALRTVRRPPDAQHHFGHGKAEYFSALIEGVMILVAAGLIIWTAVSRLLNPVALEDLGPGLAVSALSSVINAAVAVLLIRAGRTHRSLVLVADGKHILTDVWTSIGVLVGVGLVAVTGWLRLDPIVAILVACNIIWTGVGLVRESTSGLMDRALPQDEHDEIVEVLTRFSSDTVQFHALQTRGAGQFRFASVHVLVPGAWSVQQGHDLVEQIELTVASELPGMVLTTHLEPIEDPASWDDVHEGRHQAPGM